MGTAGLDPVMASNIEFLQKQSLRVEFHLDHTDYNKIENIGTGAYGVVCSALNKKTRQKVAIKKIPNIFTLDPRYAVRTYREIKILQHFKHDNVIAIREILQPPKKDITDIYVVMDLMESDLHRIIYSKQMLSDEHIKYFLYQILRGLKYIHSANVIHRDLKPSNLLVNADCELKIGDFGMARGINFKAEKSNQMMTQYVATRWYRAPELIVACRQGYGPPIDMWSVGCIFAEMIRRKHLFPGKDLLNQLVIIFGTLGIPSQKYLDTLDSETVCGFIKKISESNEVKQKTCDELCPKASPEAIDLISKMLVIEPDKRITVEEALSHPFLSKYHDSKYEPFCSKPFDFAFEQELVNLQTDEEKRSKIQDLLKKEVLTYKKPAAMDFGFLIQSKPASTSASVSYKDGAYADLNDFFAKLTSPVNDSQTVVGKESTMSDAKAEEPKTNSLLNINMKKNTKSSQNNLLLSSSVQMQSNVRPEPSLKDNSNQANVKPNSLLLGIKGATTNRTLVASNEVSMDSFKNNLLGKKGIEDSSRKLDTLHKTIGEDLNIETSAKLQANDIEMLSAKLEQTDISQLRTEPGSLLDINTLLPPSTEDIEMLSAKLDQADISDTHKNEEQREVLDTKSLLRQRIMQAQMNKQSLPGKVKSSQDKAGKSPITAYQRQKERKEIKKQREQKALQKKKKSKEAEAAVQFLTSEDQRMLERWKQMAKPQAIQPKPLPATIVTSENSNVIVVYPHTIQNPIVSHTLATSQSTNPTQTQPGSSISGDVPNGSRLHHNSDLITRYQSQSVRILSEITPVHISNSESEEILEVPHDASFYDQIHSYGNSESLYDGTEPIPAAAVTNSISDWANSMSVNTTLDLESLVKPKSPSSMFISTPKGTGAGYGVGYELETMLSYTGDVVQNNLEIDSAPLSASFLADWMDATGNMDPQFLDEIEQELSSVLDDFPFTSY